MAQDAVDRLSGWYLSQCDGDWEHQHGIHISNFDNPGWNLKVDLRDTDLEDRSLTRVWNERSEHDWFGAWTDDSVYHSVGGPMNLNEMITRFLDWAADSEIREQT